MKNWKRCGSDGGACSSILNNIDASRAARYLGHANTV